MENMYIAPGRVRAMLHSSLRTGAANVGKGMEDGV
jgi:hypothetical protein